MVKTILVARHEFWRHVLRRGFLFAVFGLPLLFGLIFAGVIYYFNAGADDPVGVVDHSGLLTAPNQYRPLQAGVVPIRGYPDEASALAALEQKEIQAYFLVAADYEETNRVTLYYEETPYTGVYSSFIRYLKSSLLTEVDPAVAHRFIENPADITFVSLSEERGRGNPVTFILPYAFGLLFVIAIFTTAGYLLQAVVDDKENRTMEIMITTISPEQLMIGRISGLVGVGLVQIIIWSMGLLIAFLVAVNRYPLLALIEIPLSTVLIAVAWFLPFYLIIATLMAAIGISVTAVSEGQQASGIVSMISVAPFWFTFIFLESPNSPLAIALSLFPFSAPISILIRWQVTEVPAWQLVTSWLILVGTAVLSLFLVSRLLRVGMLRYGQRLSLRDIAHALAGETQSTVSS